MGRGFRKSEQHPKLAVVASFFCGPACRYKGETRSVERATCPNTHGLWHQVAASMPCAQKEQDKDLSLSPISSDPATDSC